MDNNALMKKISFIIQMVNGFKIFKLPVSWFEYSEFNDKKNKGKISIFNFLSTHKKIIQEYLEKQNIFYEIDKPRKNVVFKKSTK